ncbi:MAG: hypothetical protein PHT69_06550 [Bacteroidales bacterium]|nr:hypothetical protein [Bacteroidales bacterium]
MNKKNIYLLTCLFFVGTTVFTQTIQNSVISSTGGSALSGSLKMDNTIEKTMIETVAARRNTLTQGFHQNNLTLMTIEIFEDFLS